MYFDHAEGAVFRPPSEANSFILRVTIGCSHNACSFCSMYKGVNFRIRPIEDVVQQINQAKAYYPDLRRVFLADGNALTLPIDSLVEILNLLRERFPKLSRVTCYAGPRDILGKNMDELYLLKKNGLSIIYLGIESGDDEVLRIVNKGVTALQMENAGKKVVAAGIKLSVMVILGLGGRELTRQHAQNSGKVISAMQPDMLSALTLMLHPGTVLRKAVDQGLFIPLSSRELLLELREMITHIDLPNVGHCLFRSNHVSNLLSLAGTLPQDRDKLVEQVDKALEYVKGEDSSFLNDRPNF